jgi:hypothetical protein
LEVTVLSNKPTIEAFEWDEFRIQVHPDYQLEELIQEVKKRWGESWTDENLESTTLWGREGRLDHEEWKTWVDGERYILIAQPRNRRSDIEERLRLGQENVPVDNFFRMSDWRRETSRKWQEDHPNWKEE